MHCPGWVGSPGLRGVAGAAVRQHLPSSYHQPPPLTAWEWACAHELFFDGMNIATAGLTARAVEWQGGGQGHAWAGCADADGLWKQLQHGRLFLLSGHWNLHSDKACSF